MVIKQHKLVKTRHRLITIFFKILLWLLATPLVLLLLTLIALQIPAVSTLLANKAVHYVSQKTGAELSLKKLSISMGGALQLEDLLLLDRQRDTLLYGHRLSASLDVASLFSKQIRLTTVELDTFTGRVARDSSGFNFDFITDAFSSGKTDSPAEADTSSAGWTFAMETIRLKHIRASYLDGPSGIGLRAQLGLFETEFSAFDLPGKNIRVKGLSLDSSRVAFEQEARAGSDTTSSAPPDLTIGISELALAHTQFIYTDKSGGARLNANIGALKLRARDIDLPAYRFDLSELSLHNSFVVYTQAQAEPARLPTVAAAPSAAAPLQWQVKLGRLDLENNELAYDREDAPRLESGMDYNHAGVKQLTVKAKHLQVEPDAVQLDLEQLSFVEKSGFRIGQLQSRIYYDATRAALEGLVLQTGNSRLAGDLAIRYPSLQSIGDSINRLQADLTFRQSTLSAKDVLYFAPQLFENPYLADMKKAGVTVNGAITGSIGQLKLSRFSLQTASHTAVFVDGEISHATQPEQLYARLSTFRITGSRADVLALLPDTLLPAGLELPERFEAKGDFAGYLKNFNARLSVASSFGNAAAKASMNPAAGNRAQPYRVNVSTEAFDLGKLLKQPDNLGPVTLFAEVDGSGFDTSDLQASVNAAVEKARLKGYEYHDLSLSGLLNKRSFTGKAAANDRNLNFVFDGRINLDPRHPQYEFTLDLKGADLRALNLSKENIRISTFIESNISDQRRKNVTGRAAVRNLLVLRDAKKYRLDSLVLLSGIKDSVWDISIRSELLTAGFKGDIALAQLPDLLSRQLQTYFNMQQPVAEKKPAAQKFDFEIDLLNPSLLSGEVIPGLEKLAPSTIKGSYDSEAMDLQLRLYVPQIMYSGVKLDSLNIFLQSDKEKLDYRLRVAEVSTSSLKTENLNLGGQLKDNSLSFQLNTNKDDSTQLLAIGGLLKSVAGSAYALQFNPGLVFNAESWSMDAANRLVFGKDGLYAEKVIIANGPRQIAINSAQPQPGAPLEIKFTDFELMTISKLLENNDELLRGTINGNLVLEKQKGVPAFRSDLTISSFAFKAVPAGTIRLKVDNAEDPQKYRGSLKLEGNGNDISASGFYLAAGKNGNINVTVEVNSLELSSVEPFTFGQMSRMSGAVNGTLAVKGEPGKPEVNGALFFKENGFRPRILDSYFVIHEGRLAFDGTKVRLDQLALYDSLGNKALVNGSADIKNLPDIGFDMQIKTDNFLALNTNRQDNPLYYGRVFLDSEIRLRGSMNAPDLEVKARLNPGSSVTYVKPESLVGKSDSKGIVEFTDSLHSDTTIMMRLNDSIAGLAGMKGIDLDATISFDKTVELKMIVDQETGDSLYLVGGGTLDFTLDRSGKTSLAGKYRINDGGYYLSINDLVRRNFKIEKGSSVTWSGDVLDAYVDLKAVYTIKTSPIDLVQEELSAMSEMEKNKYRNLLTFNVYLKMTGFISSPEISFDIQLAPGDRGALNGSINSRLAQLREDETGLNKQVFALLTLRRFVSDNPLDNGNEGGGLSSASRSSASKVLTQQLNALSDRYVNFVDLDLGVNSFEDYSTGQEQGRTQLQVGISKQLLKDKVTVRVGGNVELEGERASQNNANDVAGNISVDYKLTSDGRYKLKAFRENQYENPIEGELTKTGMGIMYIRNYNTFRELLSKPAKRINTDNSRNEEDKK